MDNKIRYIQAIGIINDEIGKADSLEDGIKRGLKCLYDFSKSDYAILWYLNEENRNIIHPFYWLGNIDLTNAKREFGVGVVGKVCRDEKSEYFIDYRAGDDNLLDADLNHMNISSMLCVPFLNEDKVLGCIQLIYLGDKKYDDVMSDIVEIMTMMISIKLKDDGWLNRNWIFNKVLFEIKNLRKSYKNGEEYIEVLKGINLNIYEGEFVVILGESGCGKSTLLNIIGGMISAEDGSVKFNGKEILGASKQELTEYRRESVGFIFQNYNLMPTLTVKQNIDFIGELVKSKVDSLELLKKVDLYDKRDVYPGKLSGGQQQRVSIARALAKGQPLILADEPTAALDYHTSIEILNLLSEVRKDGKTLVMVTHNEEITKMADRVIRLRDGKIYEVSVVRNPVKADELVW